METPTTEVRLETQGRMLLEVMLGLGMRSESWWTHLDVSWGKGR